MSQNSSEEYSQSSFNSLGTSAASSSPNLKRKYLVKTHDSEHYTPPAYIPLVSSKDIFKVSTERFKMNRLDHAKKQQQEYLDELKEKGGDIHFYKKTYFSYRYEREVIFI